MAKVKSRRLTLVPFILSRTHVPQSQNVSLPQSIQLSIIGVCAWPTSSLTTLYAEIATPAVYDTPTS
jgi:hypothetical protein